MSGAWPYITIVLMAIVLLSIRIRKAEGAILEPFHLAGIALLIAFQGGREDVGTDDRNYQLLFEAVSADSLRTSLEQSQTAPLYVGLSYIVKSVGGGYAALTMIVAILSVMSFYWGIKILRVNPAMPFAVYCLYGTYASGFNVMRQTVAVGFVLLVWACWKQAAHPFWGAIFALVAIGFHSTAIFPLAVFVFILLPAERRVLASFVLIIVAAALGPRRLLNFLASDDVVNRYVEYLEVSGATLGRFALLTVTIILFGAILVAVRNSGQFAVWRSELVLGLVGIIALIVSLQVPYTERLGAYFIAIMSIPSSAAFRNQPSNHGGAKSKLIIEPLPGLTILALGLLYFVVTVPRYGHLVPYSTWLM